MPRLTLLPMAGHPAHTAGAPDASARVLDVDDGAVLLDAALSVPFAIATLCGGGMSCRTCRVHIVAGTESGVVPAGDKERRVLAKLGADDDERLSCQVRIVGDVSVRVPPPPGVDV